MSDRGFVPHVENNVRMRGAPGMEFGMESSRALRDAGNGIADGLNGLGRGILAAGGAMREFVERKADTQNKLMATQADNLYLAIQEELNNRMAANPASYKDFPKWADEADQRYLDESRQYTEQMTTDFRELYYARKEHDRIQDLSKRQMIATQAEVTNQYNMMQTQLKSAAEQGRADNYKEILEAHRGVLISEDEYNLRMSEYGKLSDSAAAKRMVDAAADSDSSVQAKAALEQLKERDSDGNFVNFKNLTEDYRDQLIRAAKTAKAQKDTERDSHVLAEINQGRPPTMESLAAAKDAEIITEEQFNRYTGWLKSYNSSIDSAAKAAKAEAKAAQTEAERLQKKSEENARDAWNYRIVNTWFSSDPNEAWAQRNEIWDAILKDVGDTGHLKELMGNLDRQMQDGLSGKSEFNSPDGKRVLKYIEDSYLDGEKFKGLKWDPWGWSKIDDQKFMQARYYEIHEAAREMLQKGKGSSEIIEDLKKRVGELNDGKIKTIMMPRSLRNKVQNQGKIEPGFRMNGWTFKGGDPANERNWSKQ